MLVLVLVVGCVGDRVLCGDVVGLWWVWCWGVSVARVACSPSGTQPVTRGWWGF